MNISVNAKYGFPIAGRTSSVAIAGIYSTQRGINLAEVLLPPELRTGAKSGSWHVGLQFAHFLRENPQRPGDGWGLFAKFGASDGNPNPFQAFFTGGVGGKGLFASRPNDWFGLGYFYFNFSNDLQSAVSPVVDFRNEQGVEAYYDFAVVPGVHVGLNFQYVEPARGANQPVFTGGLRLRLRL